jgi:signal transduction histidine kinase
MFRVSIRVSMQVFRGVRRCGGSDRAGRPGGGRLNVRLRRHRQRPGELDATEGRKRRTADRADDACAGRIAAAFEATMNLRDALPDAACAPLALIVVDDSPSTFESLRARLAATFSGLRAVRVDTPAALARALDEPHWSAVLCDHRVAGLAAMDALRLTRQRAPDLPFIVSGAVGEEVAVAAMQSGAQDVVAKDDPARLLPAIAQAVELARSRMREREIEAALVESEARFRSLAANLPGMVFQLEVDGCRLRPVFAGEGARRLFGLTAADVAANAGAWLDALPADERERLCDRLRYAAQPWIDEVIVIPGDTRSGVPERHLELTARARRVGATRVLWDGIASDVTRQKEAERELTTSREALRELAGHLARVRETERAAIARELHDEVGSTLTGAKLQLQWLKGRVLHDADVADKVGQLFTLVDSAITASSRIMQDLRPAILDQGIVAALEWQARRFEQHTGVRCRFLGPPDELSLPAASAIVVFRVCQEALNNVAKHAHATSAEVTIALDDDGVVLEVRDDGRGMRPQDAERPGCFGLRGMRERALSLGGEVSIAARDDGAGSEVRLVLPREGG